MAAYVVSSLAGAALCRLPSIRFILTREYIKFSSDLGFDLHWEKDTLIFSFVVITLKLITVVRCCLHLTVKQKVCIKHKILNITVHMYRVLI